MRGILISAFGCLLQNSTAGVEQAFSTESKFHYYKSIVFRELATECAILIQAQEQLLKLNGKCPMMMST